MMKSIPKRLFLRQQGIKANNGRVWPRYIWCLCLVFLCNISSAQQGQGIAAKQAITNQKATLKVMHNNGDSWLVGPNGMTLYGLVKEKARLTTCLEDCAKNWPPLYLMTDKPNAPLGLEGKLDKVKRLPPDHQMQVTYKGQQLYYWSRDKLPGDKTGNGIGGIWHVVKP